MKLYILSILSLGTAFATQTTSIPEKATASSLFVEQTSKKTELSADRALKFYSTEFGAYIPPGYQSSLPYVDIALSYRTKVYSIERLGGVGIAQKVTLGLDPLVNTIGLIFESSGGRCGDSSYSGPVSASLGYETMLFASPKENTSTYFTTGLNCHVEKQEYSIFEKHMHVDFIPGVGVGCGIEIDRKTSAPYFVEAGLNVSKRYYSHYKWADGFYYIPGVKCGFSF